MNNHFKVSDILASGPGSNALSGTCRVLAIVEASDELWLIDRPKLKTVKGQENRFEEYVRKPYMESLTRLTEQLHQGQVVKLNISVRSFMSDEDRVAAAKTDEERAKVQKDIGIREQRFACIRDIVCEPEQTVLRSFLELVRDPDLPNKILAQATLNGVSVRHVYKTLHQFWAGGANKNALRNGYDRCGNPGLEKPQRRHLGRKSKVFHAGLVDSDGYAVSDECKRKIAYGYALLRQGVTVADAYLMTMGAHWATHEDDQSTGKVVATLFDRHQRPTVAQFVDWGKKATNQSVTELLLGPIKQRQKAVAFGGSEQDLVIGIGQVSGFDATSTDVYLTRTNSRLKRLPPMTRSLLKDVRSGVIYGVYCGWDGASPVTALKTILSGADPDKKSWAARFDIEMPDGAMPAMLARQHLADHGELKAEEATEAERQFGFGVIFAPTMQGDRKGGIESQHKSDHAKLDHKLPGTTFGKRTERGQAAPVIEALWNYYEYMRELILHIIEHNTRELVPELAPDAMLLADPPIPPTRINIYNWLTAHGMNNSLPVDYEAMRAFCLPYVDAIVRKTGVYPVLEINGRKRIIPRLRFTSHELIATGLLSQVKRTNRTLSTRIRMDHENPYSAWLPTKAGLIPMQSCVNDRVFRSKVPLAELVAMMEELDLNMETRKGEEDQFQLTKLMRRANVTATAKAQAKDEVACLGRRVSNAELKRDLRRNKAMEIEYLQQKSSTASHGNPASEISVNEDLALDEPSSNSLSMADLLMERHNARSGRA
jgi:hypothetical protein